MIKIIIADDHGIFREGLQELLKISGKYEVIAVASNGAELIDILANTLPDIILLDIDMPVMDGVEAAGIISRTYPSVKVLILSMLGDENYYYQMIDAGVKGFILKESSNKELENALQEISQGGSYFSRELLRSIIYKSAKEEKKPALIPDNISKRELEVLQSICEGLSNDEIGERLFINTRTVEMHKAHLFEKTNTKNTIKMILYAIKHKMVEINIE